MIDFYTLFEFSEVKAIEAALDPSLASIWRMKLRDYSIKFHTPLHEVQQLDPMFVLQHLYEDRYHPSIVEDELEELLDKLQVIKDPTYSRLSQQETEDLVDAVINRELKRASVKKAAVEKVEEKVSLPKPKSGSMNFSQLEELESKSESNKGGFDL